MNEEVQMYLEDAEESMTKTINHLKSELSKLRAGKANPHMLNSIYVDYYGNKTPLNQVANVGTPDARTIMIQPWEKSMISVIEKEIMKANLGLNPENNGELIRIKVPVLTEERRLKLVKQVKTEGENAKVVIRKSRRETIEGLKDLKKDGLSEDLEKKAEDDVQKLTNNFTNKVNTIIESKENDIMTI